jgi:hypothetical protein
MPKTKMLKFGQADPRPCYGTAGLNCTALHQHGTSCTIKVNAGGTEASAFCCDISIGLDRRLAEAGKDCAKAEDRLLRASDRSES